MPESDARSVASSVAPDLMLTPRATSDCPSLAIASPSCLSFRSHGGKRMYICHSVSLQVGVWIKSKQQSIALLARVSGRVVVVVVRELFFS